jgi:hypothetical protein
VPHHSPYIENIFLTENQIGTYFEGLWAILFSKTSEVSPANRNKGRRETCGLRGRNGMEIS